MFDEISNVQSRGLCATVQNMKAIVLTPGTTHVQLIDAPEPKIVSSTEVRARTLMVGICGTDREEAAGGRADAPIGEKQLIIGHEVLAEVIEVGADVKTLKPKDLIVIMVRRGCGNCEPCKKGYPDMCRTGNYTERGIKQRHGFQCEIIVDEEEFCILVPPHLRSIGVLTEPTTVIEKALDHACRLQVARLPTSTKAEKWLDKKTVLIAGLGPIGLLAAMVLRLRGAHVLGLDIVEPHSSRPKLFEALGGKYFMSKEGVWKQIEETYGPIHMMIEAAGVPKLNFDLIEKLGTDGVYAMTGVPGGDHPLNVDGAAIFRQIVLKNQLIFGSVNASKRHFQQAVLDLEEAQKKWPGVIEQFITAKVPFAQFQTVLSKKPIDEIKAVITWHLYTENDSRIGF